MNLTGYWIHYDQADPQQKGKWLAVGANGISDRNTGTLHYDSGPVAFEPNVLLFNSAKVYYSSDGAVRLSPKAEIVGHLYCPTPPES